MIASVATPGSASSFSVKSLKRSRTRSMTTALSLTTIAVAVSSVNRGSNVNPSPVKKSTDRSRSSTARFTNIIRALPFPAISTPFLFFSGLAAWDRRETLGRVGRENVRQAHEGDERPQVRRGVPQAHAAPEALRGELKPGERVHRHRVAPDAGHVAERDLRAALRSSSPHTRVQRPGRSARVIGPLMAKATAYGPGVGISR